MVNKRLAPPLFFILLLLAMANADDVNSIIRFESITPELILTEFNVTPTILNQGQTADFAVAMQNIGLSSTTANTSVEIYNSLGALVSSFNYDPVVVGQGATVIIVRTWDSDSLSAGIYTAYVNATYGNNETNTLNTSFVIRSIPPDPPSSSVPSGGTGSGKPKPTPVPPSMSPVWGKLRFSQVPVVKELLAGEGELESFMLINTDEGNATLKLSVSGVDDWVTLRQNRTVVFENSSSIINAYIEVPKNVLSGNYLMAIEAIGEDYYAKDYMMIRVKNYPKWHRDPIYLKTIRTDIVAGVTDVSLRIMNPSENSVKKLTLKETIPQGLKTGSMTIGFKNKRGEISKMDNADLITWTITGVGPLEETTIRYTVNNVLMDYHSYATWHLRQMDIGAGYDVKNLIRIIDISSETISPGSSGAVTATILYAGEEPLEVTAMLELPTGFRSDPGYTKILLIPRGLTNINFKVAAPKDVAQTHLIRAVIMGKDFNVFSSAPIMVRKGTASGFPGTSMVIGSQAGVPTIASVSIPGLDIAIVAIAVIMVLGMLLILLSIARNALGGISMPSRGEVGKPTYDFDRVKSMGRMKDVISKSIKDKTNE